MAIRGNLRISGVWRVGWWHLITSVRLIQVGNNRNDHFRYFLGVRVRLIKVSFKANKGNKFWDFGYCPLNRGCPLNTGFTVLLITSFDLSMLFALLLLIMIASLDCSLLLSLLIL